MNRIISMISTRSKYKNGILVESNNLDTDKRYQVIIKELDKDILNQDRINEFFNLLVSSKANCTQPLTIIEKCNKIAPLYSKILLTTFNQTILPYIDDYKGVSKEVEKYEGLTQANKTSINETIEEISIADRIANNHETLSKRFNLEECIRNLDRITDYTESVNKFCSLISTYNIKDYQKMNLSIEEMTYLIEKNGYKCDLSKLYTNIAEYYLNNTDESSENIIRVFEENKLVDGNDIEKVISFLKNPNSKLQNVFIKYIRNKKKDEIYEAIKEAVDSFDDYQLDEAIDQFYYFINTTEESDYNNYLREFTEDIRNRDLTREQLISLKESRDWSEQDDFYNFLNEEISLKYPRYNLECLNYVNEDSDLITLHEFGLKFNLLTKLADKFNRFLHRKEKNGIFHKLKQKFKNFGKNKLTSMLFGEGVNIQNAIGSDGKADITVAMIPFDEEVDSIELSNIVNSLINEFNNEILIEYNNCTARAYYIMIEGMVEIHIKDKSILNEEDLKTLYEDYTEPTESEFQDSLSGYDFTRISELVDKYKTHKLKPVVEYLNNISQCTNFTFEHFECALEALTYLGLDKREIEKFGTKYLDSAFTNHLNEGYNALAIPEDVKVERLVNEWESKNNPDIEIAMEAYELLVSIFEDAGMKNILSESTLEDRMRANGFYSDADEKADRIRNKKDEEDDDKNDKDSDDDEDDEEDEKSSKKKESKPTKKPSEIYGKGEVKLSDDELKKPSKFSLTGIKLGLKGLAAKFKKMSTKEKEVSRNADHLVRHFVDSMRSAASNERRERIIKGSVIPSFSKCIKFAITIAGMGALAYAGFIPVFIPVITAIGGFAMDKRLTQKEKMLLLDEIDTELEVIEKELSIADSNNQINKYRALLRYKKDLQRQYQRIRYNIRVGKDLSPSSDFGMIRRD